MEEMSVIDVKKKGTQRETVDLRQKETDMKIDREDIIKIEDKTDKVKENIEIETNLKIQENKAITKKEIEEGVIQINLETKLKEEEIALIQAQIINIEEETVQIEREKILLVVAEAMTSVKTEQKENTIEVEVYS